MFAQSAKLISALTRHFETTYQYTPIMMSNLTRRKLLKIVHWTMLPLLIWFALIGPPEAHALGPWGFPLHSNLALLFVLLCLIWTGDFLWRGTATKRTPKLSGWAQQAHWWMHRLIIWGLFFIALGGFLLGLTANRVLKAGGFLPIAPPMDMKAANDLIGYLHIVEFYGVVLLIGFHALFHLWRHFWLKDNALRIMAPKGLHRFL